MPTTRHGTAATSFGTFSPTTLLNISSYYDYYQPEARSVSDTYIAKTASINEEIDMLRHSATRSLFERRDVIVVASISCIYGLGIPSEYLKAAVKFEVGQSLNIRSQLRSWSITNIAAMIQKLPEDVFG